MALIWHWGPWSIVIVLRIPCSSIFSVWDGVLIIQNGPVCLTEMYCTPCASFAHEQHLSGVACLNIQVSKVKILAYYVL